MSVYTLIEMYFREENYKVPIVRFLSSSMKSKIIEAKDTCLQFTSMSKVLVYWYTADPAIQFSKFNDLHVVRD